MKTHRETGDLGCRLVTMRCDLTPINKHKSFNLSLVSFKLQPYSNRMVLIQIE